VEAPEDLPVRCDPDALALALTELLANAMQASRQGGAVRFTAQRKGDHVRIGVIDEGPGIDRDRRHSVFEPFNRGPLAWSPAGMGLALVREVARGHHGEARVVAEEVGVHLELEWPA
jgi:two-component system, OmpR family, sensor kinase